jgi:hypothetical protein
MKMEVGNHEFKQARQGWLRRGPFRAKLAGVFALRF